MTQNCYVVVTDGVSCIHCDSVAGVVGVPEQVISEPIYGWNASARSSLSQSGDCYTEFDSPYSTGVVLGLTPTRIDSNPANVQFGIYLYESAGAFWYVVTESGVQKTTPVKRNNETDLFRIERSNGAIYYYVAGKRIYKSLLQIKDALYVVACLYASNDGVG